MYSLQRFTKLSLFRGCVCVWIRMKMDRYDDLLNLMLCIAATDGGDKILSDFSALYAHSAKPQEKTKEHLESLCYACLANLKLERLGMWPMRIKAAAYIYMLHIHAALNEKKIFAIWRSHRRKVFVCWNSHKIRNLTLFFLPLAVDFVNVSFVGNAF